MLEQIVFNIWISFPHYIKFLYGHINAILAVLKGQHNVYQIQHFVFTLFKILQKTPQILPLVHRNVSDTKLTCRRIPKV